MKTTLVTMFYLSTEDDEDAEVIFYCCECRKKKVVSIDHLTGSRNHEGYTEVYAKCPDCEENITLARSYTGEE